VISIIVPVLNEAALVREFLAELRRCVPRAEILVVDGHSTAQTADYAPPLCDRVLQATGGPRSADNNNSTVKTNGPDYLTL
jgi:glycosyltransferase involved in cell wall biosynthesis